MDHRIGSVIAAVLAISFVALLLMLAACGGGGGGGGPPPPPPTPTIADVTSFLATSRCPDGVPAAFEPGCAAAPQKASDVMTWRRHDWSGHIDGQVEDAFVSDGGSYYVNTFSYPPNGPFVPSNGDGGDVLVTDGTTVRIDFTQNGDGNGGTRFNYWCGGTGWVSFDDAAPTGSWRGEVASLNSSPSPGGCPSGLNSAYTQWRLETVDVPYVIQNNSQKVASLPAVISEHYGAASASAARSMERVVMAQGIGRVLWEAWTTTGPGASFTCPGIAGWSDPPAPGWYLQDRRCLTQFEPDGVLTGDAFAWPGAGFAP